ncbi:MAG: Rpn family recombination-promoting nuclease/putative transposase [Alphaproteobacteria bacterium]|nr:Rpn family recombination-promoting nuclease/putative transposase [Alphaproteobacteria bacterium]MBP9777094.1 Rpn family recombination-promoting nuclease/putative transposase [Alphaproteobacteria bacterium]
MTKKLSPHDRFTRSIMANPKVAEEFFQTNLPEQIKSAIDFSSIKLQKESFIDDNLKLQIADLLYAVKFNGKSGFLYILFEHASKSDPLLPFRMLKYMISIMDNHLKTKKTNKLPFVYPIILYTGKKPYIHSMDLFDLFPAEERELVQETLTSPYHLIDLTKVSDEELKKYLWFGTMALTLKHIHDSDILPFFESIFEVLKELEKQGEESYNYTLITYIAGLGNTPHQGDFIKAVKKLEFVNEEKVMSTILEYLKPELLKKVSAQARIQALEEGLEKGRQEGRQKERIEIAKALLLKGIDIETVAGATELSKEEIKKLLS